jgi:hypothetical protein
MAANLLLAIEEFQPGWNCVSDWTRPFSAASAVRSKAALTAGLVL